MQAEELWNHFIEEYPRYKHHTERTAGMAWFPTVFNEGERPPGREDRHYLRL